MRESSREAMRRKILGLGAAAILSLGACSSGTHDASPTTARVSSTSTGDETVPNSDDIPPVINITYVDGVLKALFHVYGNATRSLVATHALSPLATADFRSIYNNPLYASEIQLAEESLQGQIRNVRSEPGDGVVKVRSLIYATSSCIFIETSTDLSAVLIHPTPTAASEYYELKHKQPGIDPGHLNATPWAISFNAAYLTPTSVANRCDG